MSLPAIQSGQIELLQGLISSHPVYGSTGQATAANLIESQLRKNNWDEVRRDVYTSGELLNEEGYVPVEEFGENYQADQTLAKTNIIATINSDSDGPTLVLNGHYDVDTVSSPDSWELAEGWRSGAISNNRIIGRGATDMLGGLTSLIEVGSRFAANKNQWCGRIVLCAVTDEEIGGNGTLHSLLTLEKAGILDDGKDIMGLIAEPSDGLVSNESLGFMHMRAIAKRQPIHMGIAKKNNNALYDMMELVSGFDSILEGVAYKLDKSDRTSRLVHNFGIIEAGKDAALPMNEVHAEATIFYPADIARDNLEITLEALVRQRHNDVIDLNFSGFSFDGHLSTDSKLTQALVGTPSQRGPVSDGTFRSPCDARLLTTYGIDDVVVYGPGSLRQAHAVDESIGLDDIAFYNDHLYRALSTLLKK